jgi:hypothetical protein
MLKKGSPCHPTTPDAPRRVLARASFSVVRPIGFRCQRTKLLKKACSKAAGEVATEAYFYPYAAGRRRPENDTCGKARLGAPGRAGVIETFFSSLPFDSLEIAVLA